MKLYTREEEIQAVKGFIAGLEEIDAFKEADDLNKTMSDFLSMLKPPEKKEDKE
jgi:hypothetical protein